MLVQDDGEQDDPPPPNQQQNQRQPSNSEQSRCKRCGAVLEPRKVMTRFGDKPTYDVYVCAACGFIGWVAISQR
jgi:DNA-directed RNA polymerase subunit M/transcription elongation factor TFIIS